MSETANVLTPRQFAIAVIALQVSDVESRVAAHEKHSQDETPLFRSQIKVFLREVEIELRRAMLFLEFAGPAEHTPTPEPDDG